MKKQSMVFAIAVVVGIPSNVIAKGDFDIALNLPPPPHIEDLKKTIESKVESIVHISPGLGTANQGKAEIPGVKIGTDIIYSIKETGTQGAEVLKREGGATYTTVVNSAHDIVVQATKAESDLMATYKKAFDDSAEQTKRSFDDAVEAQRAIHRYEERMLKDRIDGFDRGVRRTQEGKAFDAVWHYYVTEPFQTHEKNFFMATQESKVISAAASSAASQFGGPGGAAAYAAWQTYRTTGDANMAFRAGVIAGLQSQIGSGEPLSPSDPNSVILNKALTAGAAGGIAVAAQGGDEKAIEEGFLKSSGAVLIQAGQNKAEAYSPKLAQAAQTVACISAKDVDCLSNISYVRDTKNRIVTDVKGRFMTDDAHPIDAKKTFGNWAGVDLNDAKKKADKIISDISKLPGTDKIVLFSGTNGKMVLTTTLGSKNLTIPYHSPQVVLTFVGSKPPFSFERVVGPKKGAAAAAHAGNYSCKIGQIRRSLEITFHGKGCTTTYHREDGENQIIWDSDHHIDRCEPEAQRFMRNMANAGMHCTAR